jgi:hypothetical protein
VNFMEWWKLLNVALAIRDEPDSLYGEALLWFAPLPVKRLDDRLVNQIINSRKPL